MSEIFKTSKETKDAKVVVVDYGLGNLRSIVGAVERVGYSVVVSSQPSDIRNATKLILPGVGAFGDGMKNLRSLNLIEVLDQEVRESKKPILGICLGTQLFANESEEFGRHEGLGWIDGSVIRIESKNKELRVPHVGWDEIKRQKDDVLFNDIPESALFYFVHSYFIDSKRPEIVTASCDYGISMPVAFHQENIFGTQFHPEKSQLFGLVLLRNFLDL